MVSGTESAAPKTIPYILDICPTSGKELGSKGDPIVKVYDGREVKFCSKKCDRKFKKDLEASFEKLDELIAESQLPFYPKTTCVITGNKLAEDPPQIIYENRLVRFCCVGCIGTFKNDPEQYIAKLDKSVIAKQSEHYPLTACPISGEELGSMGDAIEVVYAGRLVKFCCSMCIPKFEKDPMAVISKIDAAWKAMHTDADEHHGHDHNDD